MNDDHRAHAYDAVFYRYQREGSLRSAQCVLPVVHAALAPRSVLDIGCGAGAWLCAHQSLGITDIVGTDGDYVDRSLLLIDRGYFRPHDISVPFQIGRSFDLVQCLEVAEHVPHQCSDTLVDNLVKHGRYVLFSAAVPGQGGEDHINEQPYEFWRDLFAARGYRLFDFVRPRIANHADVEPWYRYNILFFAHESAVDALPESVRATRVGDNTPVPDRSPIGYRFRKLLLRQLPPSAMSRLAVWKHQRAIRTQ